ncbi:MAG: sodium:solute symporter family protein [Candidatus Methanomethylicota archaeon]|uniref:Sodium:solute symporter family protein n=1 Tax=Thermoproteota archaeon TaxID=2056631 RepID=A0A497ERR2_9CREN|nr:MAG: sodium:solute symporter family protein [Candidatus Verstraetearchaeota archaeon]
MEVLSACLALLVLYLVLGSLLALVSRRRLVETAVDYYIASSKLSGFVAAMTYAATTYSAFMMVGLVGFSYAFGVGALGFELVYFVGTLFLLGVFAKKVLRRAKERMWVSPSEMLGDLYGSRLLAGLTALIYLIALIPYASAQLKGIGELVAGIARAEGFYAYGVLLGLVVIVLWTALAGIWSVAWTDVFQGVWMIAAATCFITWLACWLSGLGVSFGDVIAALEKANLTGVSLKAGFWKPVTFISFTLPWLFFAVTNPQVVQRLYMPRDEGALVKMVAWFAVFGFSYTIIVTLIGLFTRGLSELGLLGFIASRDLVTPTLLSQAPILLSAFVFTSIVAAAVSTADSIVLTLASCITRDLYVRRSRRALSEVSVGRIVVVTVVAAMAILAYMRIGFIVELSVLSSVLLLPLAPITLIAWAKPVEGNIVKVFTILALMAGFAVGVYAALLYGPVKAFIATWYGLPISAWILITSSLLTSLGYVLQRLR